MENESRKSEVQSRKSIRIKKQWFVSSESEASSYRINLVEYDPRKPYPNYPWTDPQGFDPITLIFVDGLEIPNTMVLFDPKKRDRHLYTYFLHLGGAWHISGNLNESCLNMLKSDWHKSVKNNIYFFSI